MIQPPKLRAGRQSRQAQQGESTVFANIRIVSSAIRLVVGVVATATLAFAQTGLAACPEKLPPVAQSLTATPAGWAATVNATPLWLSGITLFDGPVEEQAALVPRVERSQSGVLENRWSFPANNDRALWLRCEYANTTVTLSRSLGTEFRECTATYNTREQVAGRPSLRKLTCH